MTKVYFIEDQSSDHARLGRDALSLLKKIVAQTGFRFAGEVPIKVHFGEKGNVTFIPPECYEAIIVYLRSTGISPSYIDTNTLYRGGRMTGERHLKTAKSHGFTQIPIVIADGEIGTEYTEVEINKEYINKCMIGKAYSRYDQFIVMSHFKGHSESGFGGALKQLAMGFASRGGKMAQHSGMSPVVNASKCIACGTCVEKCAFDAIYLDDVAVIDEKKCVGCAGCIAVCPEGAIRNAWSGSHFMNKMAEYAYGAAKGKEIIYITFAHNITPDCDCVGHPMELVAEDIGVFASMDPVALDTACLDMVQKRSERKLFEEGREVLRHAEKTGLGSMSYELIEIQP